MSKPVVLFACVHNGGRSLAAKVLAEHHAGGRVDVRSAGSERRQPQPGRRPGAARARPQHRRRDPQAPHLRRGPGSRRRRDHGLWRDLPRLPGKTYEDWPLDDPKGQDLDTARRIVDQIDERVQDLLGRLGAG